MDDRKVVDIKAARSKRKKDKNKKVKAKKSLSPRQQKQRNKKIVFIICCILFLAATIGYSGYKIVSLKIEQIKLKQEQDKLTEEKKALEEEKERISEPEYIEEQAREKLKLVLPGEILYMLPENNGE